MSKLSGGHALVGVLEACGVTHLFTVPGESFLPVLDAAGVSKQISLVACRHESGAAFAAEAFGKVTGRPAVCMGTRGPGAANLSIGIQTANYDGTPLVALLGLIPTAQQSSRAFQEFDLLSMFSSQAKRTLMVSDRGSLELTIAQAVIESVSGRPGSVVVGLPSDLLAQFAPPRAYSVLESVESRVPEVTHLAELLRRAARPAILVSTEAVRGECAADIAAVADAVGAPVFCGWRRFSAFDNGHPRFAGSVGLGAPAEVVEALAGSDLVVAIGRSDQITVTAGRLDRVGLHFVEVVGAPHADLARQLTNARTTQILGDPAGVARKLREAFRGSVETAPEKPPRGYGDQTPPGRALAILDRTAAEDAIVVSDAGDFAHGFFTTFRFDRQRVFLGPVNGAMGYGLPGAVGAALAWPGRQVIAVAGDGGALMTAGEMETATREGLDILAIVFNNRAYGTIRSRQQEAFPGREYGTALGDVRFAGIAEAMGWWATSTASLDEFESALVSALPAPGRRLVEFRY